MRNRIAMWAGAGFVVAGFWVLYVFATWPFTNEGMRGLRLLAGITCPITFVRHHPISLYTVLIANAATYALVGLIVETLRQHRTNPQVHRL
jgi:hypothetical protein